MTKKHNRHRRSESIAEHQSQAINRKSGFASQLSLIVNNKSLTIANHQSQIAKSQPMANGRLFCRESKDLINYKNNETFT